MAFNFQNFINQAVPASIFEKPKAYTAPPAVYFGPNQNTSPTPQVLDFFRGGVPSGPYQNMTPAPAPKGQVKGTSVGGVSGLNAVGDLYNTMLTAPQTQKGIVNAYNTYNSPSSGVSNKGVSKGGATQNKGGTTQNKGSYSAEYLSKFEDKGAPGSPERDAAWNTYMQSKSASANVPNQQDLATQERDAMMKNINTSYGQGVSYLDSLIAGIQGRHDEYEDTAAQPFNAQLPLLQQARDSALGYNQQNIQQVGQGREDALSQARRLYHELSQGSQQRYGGTSSAGEFAQAIQGRNLQENQAGIIQTAAQNLGKLYQYATDVNDKYQKEVQSINMQKQSAIQQAKMEMQSKIQDLENKKFELGQNKNSLQLQALQEFYNSRQAIEQQAQQVALTLSQQAAQARANLQNAIMQYQANVEKQQPTLEELPQSQYDAINKQVYGNTPELIQGYLKKPYDQRMFASAFAPAQ